MNLPWNRIVWEQCTIFRSGKNVNFDFYTLMPNVAYPEPIELFFFVPGLVHLYAYFSDKITLIILWFDSSEPLYERL